MKSFPFFRLLLTILVVGSMCFLTYCRKDVVYSQFCSIPSEKWAVDEEAQFDYTIADTAADYRMLIYVRHTERYPYQNMWLFVNDNHRTDTIEFYLADDRGQWLGDKHHGFIEMPVLFEETKHFADTGTYHMSVCHGMRDSLLRGVTDVGLEIMKIGD
jgi:gliding motility-associated lipoprotein GldH